MGVPETMMRRLVCSWFSASYVWLAAFLSRCPWGGPKQKARSEFLVFSIAPSPAVRFSHGRPCWRALLSKTSRLDPSVEKFTPKRKGAVRPYLVANDQADRPFA